jgi:hypothetical protein
MRMLFRLGVLSLATFGAKNLYDRYINPPVWSGSPDDAPVNLTDSSRATAAEDEALLSR